MESYEILRECCLSGLSSSSLGVSVYLCLGNGIFLLSLGDFLFYSDCVKFSCWFYFIGINLFEICGIILEILLCALVLE